MNSMKVKKGDKVQVIAGKDKGKQGTILPVSYTHLTLPTTPYV